MKQPFKLHRGPGECIGALWALCIDKLDHAALISLCCSAVRQNEGPGFVFRVGQPTPARFSSPLKYKLWFLSSWPNQWAIYLRCRLPQNLRQNP